MSLDNIDRTTFLTVCYVEDKCVESFFKELIKIVIGNEFVSGGRKRVYTIV